MHFKPNPLLYGATEDFLSTFKVVLTMSTSVDHEILSNSVAKAMVRFPYFNVYPEKNGNNILLQFNPKPVPVFNDGRCVVLGTEESNGHLLAFGCEGRKLIMNVSHFIADGMGIIPLLKTVVYLYVSEEYGMDGLNPKGIDLPDDPVMPEEYEYPFSNVPTEIDAWWQPKKMPDDVYRLDPDAFDKDGLYAYHLHIPQKSLMAIANPSDGSPVSFLSVMLHRALYALDHEISQPMVAHVQHQYRAALKLPYNRHNLVSYVPVILSPKSKDWHVERQNTVMRGQIILGGETEADLYAINRLLSVFPDAESMSLSEKKQAMQRYIENSIQGKTFGISYVGKINWNGLDQYIEEMHAYLGEKNSPHMLLIEVTTTGGDFSITLMQAGRGDRYVKAFVEQMRSYDIPVSIVGEERYTLCDTKIPD